MFRSLIWLASIIQGWFPKYDDVLSAPLPFNFLGFKNDQNLQSFVPRITVLKVSNSNHAYWELETVALEYLSPKICKLVPSHLSHSKPGACLLVPLTEFRNIICALETRACQIKLTCTYKLCIRYFCLSIFLLFFQISTAEWLSHQLSVSTPNIPLYHRCTTSKY